MRLTHELKLGSTSPSSTLGKHTLNLKLLGKKFQKNVAFLSRYQSGGQTQSYLHDS